MSLLHLQEISVTLGDRSVLERICFRAGRGEFLALTGANGAGKSTLMDVCAGLRVPTSGAVQRQHPQPRVVHLPQSVAMDVPFSAGQMVAMGRYPHTDRWFESDGDHQAVEAAMRRTGCWLQRDRPMHTLSGGERQRVLLAACLAQDGDVLLLDEPSTYLDVEHQMACFSLLQEEAARGKLCIAITHDLNLALTFCSRLLVLAESRLAWDSSVIEAGQDPAWLGLFSSRLRLGRVESGAPWVWYQ